MYKCKISTIIIIIKRISTICALRYNNQIRYINGEKEHKHDIILVCTGEGGHPVIEPNVRFFFF